MKFLTICETLEKINSTTKRNDMTKHIVDLLSNININDVQNVVYVLQGNPSNFSGKQLFISTALTIEAIAKTINKPIEEIKFGYQNLGDIGLYAEKVINNKGILSLKDVVDTIIKISSITGNKSQDIKVNLISQLLKKSNNIEAKWLVKLLTDSLRLGSGDVTIIDALSTIRTKNKDESSILKNSLAAFNNDLGKIAFIYLKFGKIALKKLDIKLFTPIAPQLADRVAEGNKAFGEVINSVGKKFSAELKYDGERLQVHKDKDGKIEAYSRNLKPVNSFPEIENEIKNLPLDDVILDGEVCGFNTSTNKFIAFNEFMQRRNKKEGVEAENLIKKLNAVYFVFDILYLNGKNIKDKPYFERVKILKSVIKNTNHIKFREGKILNTEQELKNYFNEVIKEGKEGLVIKRLDSPYSIGKRNGDWIKLKKAETIDAIITGYNYGEGNRARRIGALVCAVYDEANKNYKFLCNSSGLKDDEFDELQKDLDSNKFPHIVVSIKHNGITKVKYGNKEKPGNDSGYSLRFPRVVEIRRDKNVKDATTLVEIEKLFNLQKIKY